MNRPTTQRRTTSRLFRVAGGICSLVLAAAPLTSTTHLATVEHTVCAAHGDLVHAVDGHHVAHVPIYAAWSRTGAAEGSHDHQHSDEAAAHATCSHAPPTNGSRWAWLGAFAAPDRPA